MTFYENKEELLTYLRWKEVNRGVELTLIQLYSLNFLRKKNDDMLTYMAYEVTKNKFKINIKLINDD